MKAVIDFFTNDLSVFFAVVFKLPSRRFDHLVGANQSEFVEYIGRQAVVIETVTADSGLVRFAGSYWQARLACDSVQHSAPVGDSVVISATEGNRLLVSAQN